MSDFFNLGPVDPALSDQFMLVRDRVGKATTLSKLKTLLSGSDSSSDSLISFSETPPDDKPVWWQIDAQGLPIRQWLLTSSGAWHSTEILRPSQFITYFVTRRSAAYVPMPVPGVQFPLQVLAGFLTATPLTNDPDSDALIVDIESCAPNESPVSLQTLQIGPVQSQTELRIDFDLNRALAANRSLRFKLRSTDKNIRLAGITAAVASRLIYT